MKEIEGRISPLEEIEGVINTPEEIEGTIGVTAISTRVVMEDNPDGGVDLTVTNKTRTLAKEEDIPKKLSELENDGDFATNAKLTELEDKTDTALEQKADKSEVPTKLSDLENDSDFTTSADLDELAESVSVQLSTKADKSEIPTIDVDKEYVDEQNALQDIDLNAVKSDVEDHEERIEALENKPSGGGNVDDVKINGTSIVTDKIAIIPLASNDTYGVTTVTSEEVTRLKDSLSSKQDKLVAGENITIENNIISSTGSGADVTKAYVDEQDALLTAKIDTKIADQYPTNKTGYYLENKLFVGDGDNNINNAFTNVRRLSDSPSIVTGTVLNGATFGVNSDGSAAFFHKTYDLSSTKGSLNGARNNAVLRFYATRNGTNSEGKLQFAVNNTTSTTPTESAYKDVAMVDDIKQVMCYDKGEKWTEAEKAKAQEKLGIVVITQEEYDLLEVKGEKTIYIII